MNREQELLVLSKRLLIVIVVWLLVTGLLFNVTLSYGLRFMVSWFCFVCGTIGGFVSIQQRLRKMKDEDIHLLSKSWAATLVAPLYGGILALVLYVLFLSGLLEGHLFPEFSTPSFGNPPTTDNIRDFLIQTYPKTSADFARFAFWSFVAGFSERFVPGIIDRVTS